MFWWSPASWLCCLPFPRAALSLGWPRFLTPHSPAPILTRKPDRVLLPASQGWQGWQPHWQPESPGPGLGLWCGPSHLPAFFTKPRSASSTSHSSQRKHPGCQLLFMALMTRPMMNSPAGERSCWPCAFPLQSSSTLEPTWLCLAPGRPPQSLGR